MNVVLPTLNEYIEAERTHKNIASKIKNDFTVLCKNASFGLLKCGIDPSKKYNIKIIWHVNNRKDHDNIAFGIKFILDGMVNAGVLHNDSPSHIWNISHIFVDSKEYLIRIELS